MKPIIGILLPCFNEVQTISHSLKIITAYMHRLIELGIINQKSFIALVDDGSTDGSWEEILKAKEQNTELSIRGIQFSRNFGHQYAVFAGLIYFQNQADAIISLDIDLQDDIEVIHEMIVKYTRGAQIVYGIRNERTSDTFFKRNSALLYYRILQLMKIDIYFNHADYRLTSKKVNRILNDFEDTDLFLRGIFPYLGFKHDFVHYDRKERTFGESKYPFRKMLKLAWIGILSFSSYPLDVVFSVALMSFGVSLALGAYILMSYFNGSVISGWTSLSLIISFFGSIQLLSIGLVSKYISKIFTQTKRRPRYIIQETIDNE